MALTKIGTDGVKDDAITSGKIPANAVGTSEIADTSVTLAKLEHGTSSNDGKFLRANNGADPTFESLPTSGISDVVSDTSPQLGGSLDMNNQNITSNDSTAGGNNRIVLGSGSDLQLWHDGNHSYIAEEGTGNLILLTSKLNINNANNTKAFIHTSSGDGVELYYNNTKVFETGADRIFARSRFNINASGINSGDSLGFGQWDGSNHRIEGDSNRPLFITSYNSSGIKLGASGAVKATVTNNGLTFNGDTAAANALDDYEQGNWTPSFSGFTNAGSNEVRQAMYTKIGNTVNIWLEMFGDNDIGWNDQAYISGLPFTGSSYFSNSLYIPANIAVMYGPSNYSLDDSAAGRCYFYGYSDTLRFKMGTFSSVRHIWLQLTYPTGA